MRKAKKATNRTTATRKSTARKTSTRAVRPGAKAWSPTDIRQLKTLYRDRTAQEVAREMNRSLPSVKAKIRTLDLKKSPTAKRRQNERRRAVTQKGTARTNSPARKKSAAKKSATKKTATKKKTTKKAASRRR